MLQVYETRAQVYVRSKTTIKFITKNNCNSGGTKLTSDYDQIDRFCLFKVILLSSQFIQRKFFFENENRNFACR